MHDVSMFHVIMLTMSVTPDMQALLEARSVGDKWDKMSTKARLKLLDKAGTDSMKYGRGKDSLAKKTWGELGPKYKSALTTALRPGPESNTMYMLRSVGNYFRGK